MKSQKRNTPNPRGMAKRRPVRGGAARVKKRPRRPNPSYVKTRGRRIKR